MRWLKVVGIGVGMSLVVTVLGACIPTFPQDARLTFVYEGALVYVTWPEASEPDEGQEIASYRIDVDGVELARFGPDQRTCVLTGYSISGYHVSVTAYDTAGEWSGDSETGAVKGMFVHQWGGPDSGTTRACVSPTDSDGDRLPDALEDNGGIFWSVAKTGTSPSRPDTDNDGIKDGDEIFGTAQLDLWAMGTRPGRKDILLEFDWFDDNNDPGDCGPHTHRPSAAAMAALRYEFSLLSVSNPSREGGINVITDYGQGGPNFTGGNRVADADGVIAGGISGEDFRAIKAANFSSARRKYFHYVLMPHRFNSTASNGGQARLNGADMIISLQCWNSDANQSIVAMHELGHNLGLRHGGNEEVNYKPNYNSVMNYLYSYDGVDTDCTVPGNGAMKFSRGFRAALNENSLSETAGICNGVDVDWNRDGLINPNLVAADINGDGLRTTLTDNNDLANLNLAAVLLGVGDGDVPPGEGTIITEEPLPLSRHQP